jgi:hypothetical protein
MRETGPTEHFINVLLWMLHGPQHEVSIFTQQAMKRSIKDPRVKESLNRWPSAFTGHTWILNRTTPPHRDSSGFNAGFDFLSVGGTARALLRVRDINLSCAYNPGTVVAIAGRVLTHEVCNIEEGDRVAVARWIRKAVILKYGMGVNGGSERNVDEEARSDEGSKIDHDRNQGGSRDLEWSTLTDFCERLAGCIGNK